MYFLFTPLFFPVYRIRVCIKHAGGGGVFSSPGVIFRR